MTYRKLLSKAKSLRSPPLSTTLPARLWNFHFYLIDLRSPFHFVSQQAILNLESFPLTVIESKDRKGPPQSLSFRPCPKAELCSHQLRQMVVVSRQEIFIEPPLWAKLCAQCCLEYTEWGQAEFPHSMLKHWKCRQDWLLWSWDRILSWNKSLGNLDFCLESLGFIGLDSPTLSRVKVT